MYFIETTDCHGAMARGQSGSVTEGGPGGGPVSGAQYRVGRFHSWHVMYEHHLLVPDHWQMDIPGILAQPLQTPLSSC